MANVPSWKMDMGGGGGGIMWLAEAGRCISGETGAEKVMGWWW